MIFSIKWSLILNVVNEHKIDASSVSALFEYARLEHFLSTHYFGTQVPTLFVFNIKFFKAFSVGVECFVEIGYLIRVKESDILFVLETTPKESRQNHPVVHMSNSRFFGSLIVLENNKVIELKMPYGIKNSCTCITDTTL